MAERSQIAFGSGRGAERYDEVLVPLIFDPWAEMLLETLPPEPGWDILDLATGTGVVASKLAACQGEAGSLTAADISADMLHVARARVGGAGAHATVSFVETSAHPLQLEDASVDALYCQQGFQFFPDGDAAAAEMHRVAKPGARIAISVWCSLAECKFFGSIAESLRQLGETEAAGMIATPFDHMPKAALESHFTSSGFDDVSIERVERELVFEGGVEQAFETIYATPLAPRLQEFSAEKTAEFRTRFTAESETWTRGGVAASPLAALVLTARK